MSYRVLAEDGHPITGQVSFAVGLSDGRTAAGPGPTARDPIPVSGSQQQAARTERSGGGGVLVPALAGGLTALGAALLFGAVRSSRRSHAGR